MKWVAILISFHFSGYFARRFREGFEKVRPLIYSAQGGFTSNNKMKNRDVQL